jgi:hypothetical protein
MPLPALPLNLPERTKHIHMHWAMDNEVPHNPLPTKRCMQFRKAVHIIAVFAKATSGCQPAAALQGVMRPVTVMGFHPQCGSIKYQVCFL